MIALMIFRKYVSAEIWGVNGSDIQGRIQDFKLGGRTLKNRGVSCEKSRFYTLS